MTIGIKAHNPDIGSELGRQSLGYGVFAYARPAVDVDEWLRHGGKCERRKHESEPRKRSRHHIVIYLILMDKLMNVNHGSRGHVVSMALYSR